MKSYDKEKFVYLNITSWVGHDSTASHYYGSLNGYLGKNSTKIELYFNLTQEQIQKLYETEQYNYYKVGDECSRFFSEEDLIKQAKKVFKQHFSNAEILVLGAISVDEPQKILVGPVEYKKKVNKFAEQREKLGWWDGKNEKEVEIIWNKWKELRNNTFPSSSRT